jgi:hypothetical protein
LLPLSQSYLVSSARPPIPTHESWQSSLPYDPPATPHPDHLLLLITGSPRHLRDPATRSSGKSRSGLFGRLLERGGYDSQGTTVGWSTWSVGCRLVFIS